MRRLDGKGVDSDGSSQVEMEREHDSFAWRRGFFFLSLLERVLIVIHVEVLLVPL